MDLVRGRGGGSFGALASCCCRCVEGGFARRVKVWLPMWPWTRLLWVGVGEGPLEFRCQSAIPFHRGRRNLR